jgi:hypothetical protein
LLNAIDMGAQHASVAKIICFVCRRSDCGCLSNLADGLPDRSRGGMAWAAAWLGGACMAGTGLGLLLARLMGAG